MIKSHSDSENKGVEKPLRTQSKDLTAVQSMYTKTREDDEKRATQETVLFCC